MLVKSGVIYESTTFLQRILRTLGYSLILASIVAVFFYFYPVFFSEIKFRMGKIKGEITQEQKTASGFGLLLAETIEQEKLYALQVARGFGVKNTDFSLYIPKISARAEIIHNVDPSNKEAMEAALMRGVAHARGSSFPGVRGGTYLFAHSTDAPLNFSRFNAVFYLLREQEIGDEIYVFFLDRLYKYKVTEKQIVNGDDISWLTGAAVGEERLILQTCWPPGTTFKRLIVVAQPFLIDK